jgi:hypothetical protein
MLASILESDLSLAISAVALSHDEMPLTATTKCHVRTIRTIQIQIIALQEAR